MTATVLVPLDGSPLAERALPPACLLARAAGGQLLLVRAAAHGVDPTMAAAHLRTAEPGRRVTLRDAQHYLADVAGRLTEQGCAVQIEALQTSPTSAILFAARQHRADLIAMTTHGFSGVRRALLGSVADEVVRDTTLPVLLVRAMDASPTGPFRTILVPLDGTAFAEAALAYLAGDRWLIEGARVVLLQALPAHEAAAGQVKEAQAYLQDLGHRYLEHGIAAVQVKAGSPGATILAVAHQEQADLIVMATHRRAGLDRLMHGSNTAQVLQGVQMPVLLVRGALAAAL
jgi:nucleotide-binding universal stress UspA family protein